MVTSVESFNFLFKRGDKIVFCNAKPESSLSENAKPVYRESCGSCFSSKFMFGVLIEIDLR